jgi:hypothetical protein
MLYEEDPGSGAAGRECELCGRRVRGITRHHLVPRSRARKVRKRKKRNRPDRRELERTVDLCGPCHRNVHVSLSNGDLERGYDSVEALKEHPGVRRFTEWIRTKPHGLA